MHRDIPKFLLYKIKLTSDGDIHKYFLKKSEKMIIKQIVDGLKLWQAAVLMENRTVIKKWALAVWPDKARFPMKQRNVSTWCAYILKFMGN